ncbi:hypothetical protein BKI52_15615 [marine bacterium AO1-C]|nr:hypothetical protein BKI52_15615 [marine bacterium AO1-C]
MELGDIHTLDTSINTLEKIKDFSEAYWKQINYQEVYGYQIQKESEWKVGLNEMELFLFEKEVGFEFPSSLRNFYRTMNGLNKPGINFFGDLNNTEPTFSPQFYSYPDDLELIDDYINWILQENKISRDEIKSGKAPFIFPIHGHRFLIFDQNEQVLSMYGNDIIAWADNLTQAIVRDVFDSYLHSVDLANFKPVNYWLE